MVYALTLLLATAPPPTTVEALRVELGGEPSPHAAPDSSLAARGERLVVRGYVDDPLERLSEHHVCIDCHAVDREDPDLTRADPDARLAYLADRSTPLLPASTLYGAVNRTGWYGGYWAERYREVDGIEPARRDLRAAIAFCARECARGREPSAAEVDAILAYLWTRQLTVDDVGLSTTEVDRMRRRRRPARRRAAWAEVAARFRDVMPASAVPPAVTRAALSGGDPDVGALVFDKSCLHCHGDRPGAPSEGSFTHSLDTYLFVANNAARGRGVHYVLRTGVHGYGGDEPYMPEFVKERLSDAQVAGLVAFLRQQIARRTAQALERGPSKSPGLAPTEF
jgi:mono/diheme cytochrome c family protein